jgi:NAD(P)-dependent dehydrogenase (short-subunit alcohol dehydrogenase family)
VDVAGLFSVEGKVALVTGGSRGIGEMIVRGLVAAGCRTYLSSRSVEACEALADELGDRCVALPADLSTPEGCDGLAAALRERQPALHLLVNNAGATWGAPLGSYPAEGFDKVMDTNVRAPFLLTQALLPALEEAATPEDPARVVMIGSVDGLAVPSFESYAYSASKAAVHMLSRHLGRAAAARDITVNAIAPGLFPSKMTRFLFDEHEEEVVAQIPRGRAGVAEDIVGTVLYLASRAGAYTTGVVLPVDGGYATLR